MIMREAERKETAIIKNNVNVWVFDAAKIKTYDDYLCLIDRVRENIEVTDFNTAVTFFLEHQPKFFQNVLLEQLKPRGVVYHYSNHNIVPNVGLQQIGALLIGSNTNSITHCQVGTSSTATDASQTDLVGAISPRLAITSRYPTGSTITNYDTFFGSADGTGTWQESGLFTAITSGIMMARLTMSSFTKDTTKTATVAWSITLASSTP